MSALGKLVLDGDFDNNGQMVVQTPAERVIERSVVVTRTVSEAPRASVQAVAQRPICSRTVARHNVQPPLPYPLAPRPKPVRPDARTVRATTC